jgi:hypothetical protein
MKTARFLFTMVGFGALTLGLGFAGESSRQPVGQGPSENQTASDHHGDQEPGNRGHGNRDLADEKHSNSNDNRHVSQKSSQAGPIKEAIPTHRDDQDRPKQVTNSQHDSGEKRVDNAQTKRASVNDPHQPGLNQPVIAAKDGWMMNKTGKPREPLARLPVGGGATALSPVVVHGRVPAPVIIGGLAASSAKNSAAVINGTGMRRKP